MRDAGDRGGRYRLATSFGVTILNQKSKLSNIDNRSFSAAALPVTEIFPASSSFLNVVCPRTTSFSFARVRVTVASASLAWRPAMWLGAYFSSSRMYCWLVSVKFQSSFIDLPSAFCPLSRMAA